MSRKTLSSCFIDYNFRMNEDWIRQVITNLPDNHPTKNILREAVRSGKIKTAVTGVDRQTGKAVIFPVKVPSKANAIT
ncbi:hypothetical protein [Neisseria meningitidis]|uniref:hypothetical protein n=1 Tax=Neisseria meningitidis TaxID=487 RepID=UPI000F5486CD|nr:hypothetical protein [Neisseria meningitidis]